MRHCVPLSLPFILAAGVASAACSDGGAGAAYALGERLARQGVDARPADEVAPVFATCFVIGYREGQLQRLLGGQPNPPRAPLPQRPRTG
ncbi:hypothetical protein [Poseidonocella sp. HB161398]|uniref:hypothetical protein n=1 Tax=Poseidonocella sp. HB161398 TaxID=2320855 RepID=UPI001108BF1D|nr:hypothetical protein [Poseidonocella sp. HB161398]